MKKEELILKRDTGSIMTDDNGLVIFAPAVSDEVGENMIKLLYRCEEGGISTNEFSIFVSTEACSQCQYSLEIISGKDQVGCPGEELPEYLEISLTDSDGNPAIGETVEVSAFDPDGNDVSYNLSMQELVISETGNNTFSFVLGEEEGDYKIRVRYNCSEEPPPAVSILKYRNEDAEYIVKDTKATANKEKCIPDLKIGVYYDINCNSSVNTSTYYPKKIEEKLYLRIESPKETSNNISIPIILRNTFGEVKENVGYLFKPLNTEGDRSTEFKIKKGEKYSNVEEITYYPRETQGYIVKIEIDKVNGRKLNTPIFLKIPEDSDNDQMADAWEKEQITKIPTITGIKNFTPAWDEEIPNVFDVDFNDPGDGFPALIEYIGYTCDSEYIDNTKKKENDPNLIRRMSSSKVDLLFTSVDQSKKDSLLTKETHKVLKKYDIEAHEVFNFLPISFSLVGSYYHIDMRYELFCSTSSTGIIKLENDGTVYGAAEKLGTGYGYIKIFMGAVNNIMAIPEDNNFPDNPAALNYRIGNWVHEKYYREEPFRVTLCSYVGEEPYEKEIYFSNKLGNKINNDDDCNDWINLYDFADDYDNYNHPDNIGSNGTPLCFGWSQEDILTRFLLHEIGHTMNFGIGTRTGNTFIENAHINKNLWPSNQEKKTCMWCDLIDPRYDYIVNDYCKWLDFRYFNIQR